MDSLTTICAGVDLGGTKISVVLGDRDGHLLGEGRIDTLPGAGPANAFERIAQLVGRLAEEAQAETSAIGVGAPGLVDPRKGVIEFLPNLPKQWNGFPAVEFLRERTGKPAFLLNDARLAALGEYSFASGNRSSDMLVVTIGTGIGGGLILDGRLRLGPSGAAGEIGHHTILPDGPVCSCGSRGCLETLVSGPALSAQGVALARSGAAPRLAAIVEGNWAAVTPKEMATAARQGDQTVATAIEEAGRYLGIGIANAVTLTAVEQVILCGGVAALGELLLEPVRAVVRERVRMFPAERVHIACSTLGDRTGALGALALAYQHVGTLTCGKGDARV